MNREGYPGFEVERSGAERFEAQVVEYWRAHRIAEASLNAGDPYGREKIDRDLKYVADTEARFEGREGREATRFSAGVMEGIEQYGWFGNGVEVIPTSRYDDIRNGTDFVVAFPREGGPSVKLAVDVTMTEDPERLGKKLGRTLDQVDRGELVTIEYFEYPKGAAVSPDAAEPRGKALMPRVIIGANTENARKLSADFEAAFSEGGKRGLGEHAIQYPLLEEIEAQLTHSLDAAVTALTRHAYGQRGRATFDVQAFEQWTDWLDKIRPGQPLPDEAVEQLEKAFAKAHDALEEFEGAYGSNVNRITEALLTVSAIIREKKTGAGEQGRSSFESDSVVETLKRPRLAA